MPVDFLPSKTKRELKKLRSWIRYVKIQKVLFVIRHRGGFANQICPPPLLFLYFIFYLVFLASFTLFLFFDVLRSEIAMVFWQQREKKKKMNQAEPHAYFLICWLFPRVLRGGLQFRSGSAMPWNMHRTYGIKHGQAICMKKQSRSEGKKKNMVLTP